MIDFGRFTLLLAVFLTGYAIIVDLLGVLRKDHGLIKYARNATVVCMISVTLAMTALWVLLLKGDFSVVYVADHTSRALPFIYKITALWAGSAGSLLLWLWIQLVFIVVVYCRGESKQGIFSARARVIANIVCAFFLIIMINDKNPFDTSAVSALDGAGLNPLLQHPAMVLHPPILFVGYAGFLIPFAWAFSWLRHEDNHQLPPLFASARNWTLIAWLFLTAGIVLGAWWAYEELGWGGYWAWDPVENSSLMPWFVATALLHCYKTYRTNSTISVWTMLLSILTFSLCIFGRFLTKYGLVSSIHAFPDPGLGILHVVLLGLLWLVALVMIISKFSRGTHLDDTSGTIHHFVIINNYLFLILTLVVFVGTLFPFLSQVFMNVMMALSSHTGPAGPPITLDSEFFTKMTAPGGMVIILLIGICPYLSRHGINKSRRSVLAVLTIIAAAVVWIITCSSEVPPPSGIGASLAWGARWLQTGAPAIPYFIVCAFLLLNIIADVIGYELKFADRTKRTATASRNLRWYGARAVHLGVAVMFIGIAGSGGYGVETKAALMPGEKTAIKQYELTYVYLVGDHGPNYTAAIANIMVQKNGRMIGYLKPAKAVYSASGKAMSEIDIRRTLVDDLYLAVTDVQVNNKLINLRILVKPLINWIWIGSFIMVIGTVLVLSSIYRRNQQPLQERQS